MKFLWDFAYNLEGRKRTEDIYRLVSLDPKTGSATPDPDDFDKHHSNRDDLAYLLGFQVGQNKKAGDWSLLATWRETGIAAVYPNLHDDDFALGFSNTRGLKVAGSYNFTAFVNPTVTYL